MEIYWSAQDLAWGLSLIGLTIAMHAMGVVMMAFAGGEDQGPAGDPEPWFTACGPNPDWHGRSGRIAAGCATRI